MFTTETGIGVVVMVVFAAIWLAFMLWEDLSLIHISEPTRH